MHDENSNQNHVAQAEVVNGDVVDNSDQEIDDNHH
jgi:hypothetical protein